MTKDDITRMAREVGMSPSAGGFYWTATLSDLKKFAALVAAAEREACAEIADRLPRIYRETKDAHERLSMEPFKSSNFGFDFAVLQHAEKIAHSIRARGQA
jgi:hypothetical protein